MCLKRFNTTTCPNCGGYLANFGHGLRECEQCGFFNGGKRMKDKILEWFGTGRVGASSRAMALCFAGVDSPEKSYPHDPDDLNRCLLLLDAVPEAREHLWKLREISPVWNSLVSRWAELEKTFIAEAGLNWVKSSSAPRTSALMEEILHFGEMPRCD